MKSFFAKLRKSFSERDKKPSWSSDAMGSLLLQRNILCLLVFVMSIGVIVSAFMLYNLYSTKKVEPFVIEIDKKTGIPSVVDPISIESLIADDAVKKYFIWKYIKAREEYDQSTFLHKYRTVVRLLSSSDVYSTYRRQQSPRNTQSDYTLYKNTTIKRIKLKSLIFITPNNAQVRFNVEIGDLGGSVSKVISKVALLEFAFENLEMNIQERLENPIGFIVKVYNVENELL